MLHTKRQQTDNSIKAMQERNAARLAIAKRVLGDKYACHPSNHIKRKENN